MQKILIAFIFLLLVDLSFWGYYIYNEYFVEKKPFDLVREIDKGNKPLEKYSFEKLQKRKAVESEINIDKQLNNDKEEEIYSYLFYYNVEGDKKVSGVITLPKEGKDLPIIVMFRGYVDPTVYYSGLGTENFAAYLAERGFVTVAPDFLGYAESDPPGEIPLQDRFQTYTTALDLLASVKNLNPALQSLEEEEKIKVTVDDKKIGIWGHSNGGHISLSTLAITGKDYPTILWNPVSKHFPYSIMFYMDEFEDQGKYLRGIVADFEEEYDIDKYSAPNYYEWINAPIQLHQGSADDILPQKWSDQLDKVLQEEDVEIEYIVHPEADHNLSGGTGWSNAARAGVEFYNQYFDQL